MKVVDKDDIGLDEIITCLLVSGLPCNGGLNFDSPRGDADREKFSEDDQYMAGFGRSADFYRSHSNQNQNIEGSSAKYLKLREQISRYPANLKKCVELIKSGHDSESPKQTSVQGHKTLDDEDLHHADEMLSAMEDYEAKYPTDSA